MIRNPSEGWPKPLLCASTHRASFICPPWKSQTGLVWSRISPILLTPALCVPWVPGNHPSLAAETAGRQDPDSRRPPRVWRHFVRLGWHPTRRVSLAKVSWWKKAPPVFSGSCWQTRAWPSLPGDCAWGRGCDSSSAPGQAALGAGLGNPRSRHDKGQHGKAWVWRERPRAGELTAAA